jgi:hypothetical protein
MHKCLVKLSSISFLLSLSAVNVWAMEDENLRLSPHRRTKLQRSHSEPLLGETHRNFSVDSSSSVSSSEEDEILFEEESTAAIREPLERIIPPYIQKRYERKDPQLLTLLYDHIYHVPHLSFGYNEWFQTEAYEDYCTNVSEKILEKIPGPMDRETFTHSANTITKTLKRTPLKECYEIIQELFKLVPGEREEFAKAIVTISESYPLSEMSAVFIKGALKLLPQEREALFNNIRGCSEMFSSREMENLIFNPNFEQTHLLLYSCKQWCEVIPDTRFLKKWLFANWDQNISLWLRTHERIKPLILLQSLTFRKDSLIAIFDCLNQCTNTEQADRMLQFLMTTRDVALRAQMLVALQEHARLPTVTPPLFGRLIDVTSQLLEGVDDSQRRILRVKEMISGFSEIYTNAKKFNNLFLGEKEVTNAEKFLYIIGKVDNQSVYIGQLLFSMLKRIVKRDRLRVLDDLYENAMKMNSDSLSDHIVWAYKKLQEPLDSAEDEVEGRQGS